MNWDYCTHCGGSLDTGWECNDCGADLMPFAAPRSWWRRLLMRLAVKPGIGGEPVSGSNFRHLPAAPSEAERALRHIADVYLMRTEIYPGADACAAAMYDIASKALLSSSEGRSNG